MVSGCLAHGNYDGYNTRMAKIKAAFKRGDISYHERQILAREAYIKLISIKDQERYGPLYSRDWLRKELARPDFYFSAPEGSP